VAEKGDPSKPYKDVHKELLLGPFLMEEMSDIFKKKWQGELNNWQRILKQLEKAAESEETIEKRQELTEKIQMVEEVLNH
jgi:tRNA (adenine22-N1)-methyltransferase